MKNDGKSTKRNDQIKEILYIEIIHQQMQTFIDIDNIIKSKSIDILTPKHNPS